MWILKISFDAKIFEICFAFRFSILVCLNKPVNRMLRKVKHSNHEHEEPDEFFDAELSGVTNVGNTV